MISSLSNLKNHVCESIDVGADGIRRGPRFYAILLFVLFLSINPAFNRSDSVSKLSCRLALPKTGAFFVLS